MASSISDSNIYSSAVCERDDFPGPILIEGNFISAWSDSVGEPKGTRPNSIARFTNGCSVSMCDEFRRKERALTSLFTCETISWYNSSFE